MDTYQEVTLQIRDAVKEDSGRGFDEEKQKEIVEILKCNFNKKDEEIGKILMENISLFNQDTGDILDGIPLFALPLFVGLGSRALIPGNTYPNYNINNKYMGYTEKGVFHKVNGTTIFIDFMKRNPMLILVSFFTTYIIVALLVSLLTYLSK